MTSQRMKAARHVWSQMIAPALVGVAIGAVLALMCFAAWEGWWVP